MTRIIYVLLLIIPFVVNAQRDWANVEIETTELAPGLHRLFVANSVSVVVFSGTDGLLVIDGAYEQSTARLREEISHISQSPIKYLINTHIHFDHTGGNKVLGKDARIIAHPDVEKYLSQDQRRGDQVTPAFPGYARPDILVEDHMDLEFNGEMIQITHMAGGHTSGDLIVYFPKANVLVLGDLLFAEYFPFVDVSNGGNPLVFLENVERISEHFPSDVTLVGGHGPVYTMDELIEWHFELTQTLAVIAEGKSRGLNADELKAQRVLEHWEDMGAFFITEDLWIDIVYPFL